MKLSLGQSSPELMDREAREPSERPSAPFAHEIERLTRHNPVEYGVTLRLLERHVPDGAHVAVIGVGDGSYPEALARRGCELTLVDVSSRLLLGAVTRLEAAGLADAIREYHQRSATALPVLASGAFSATLLLGPLYHLRDEAARACAVREAARITSRGGVLFAAAINRLAYLRDAFRDHGAEGAARLDFCRRFLRDGNPEGETAGASRGYAHLTTPDVFRRLFVTMFGEIALVGTESFTSPWHARLIELPDADQRAWIELVLATAEAHDGLGSSDHFLYIGRRR